MTDDVLLELTGDIVATHVLNNTVSADELPGFIKAVHDAFAGLGKPAEPAAPEFTPAVSVRKSLASRDAIISMIDGKPYRMLKRHLSQHGLTPAEYRERYNLPSDYPMTATSYSEHRKDIAAKIGLGRRALAGEPAPEVDTSAPDALLNLEPAKARRGRPRKVADDEATSGPKPATRKPRLSGKAALAKVRGES